MAFNELNSARGRIDTAVKLITHVRPDLVEGLLSAVDRLTGVRQGFQPEDVATPEAREEAAVGLVEGMVLSLGVQIPDQRLADVVGGQRLDQSVRQPERYVSLAERIKQRGGHQGDRFSPR